MINMSDRESKWLFEHLGHTGDIDIEYYRHTLSFIERTQMAKLLLMIDNNCVKQYSKQKVNLKDIDIKGESYF